MCVCVCVGGGGEGEEGWIVAQIVVLKIYEFC